MWILPALGYVGIVAGFTFLTLAIASGLYYLSELVEEHTVVSKKVLTRLIQVIITLHILMLIFDGFPIALTIFSAASHAVYGMNMRRFPMVSLTDGWFLGSCVLVISNHLLWFRHFSDPPSPYSSTSSPSQRHRYTYDNPHFGPTFSEISAFFGICVWLVPFSLFVSLSASENVLPSTMDVGGGAGGSNVDMGGSSVGGMGFDPNGKGRKKGRTSMLNSLLQKAWEWSVESAQALGLVKQTGGKRFN